MAFIMLGVMGKFLKIIGFEVFLMSFFLNFPVFLYAVCL